MSRRAETLPKAYFAELYAGGGPDPWGFETSPYEQAKYAATLGCLSRPRYGSAFEAGCSIGVLTRRLAERCDALVALDPVPAAVEAARRRCADQPWVSVHEGAVPDDWPDGRFDLILFSEVLYFFTAADVAALAARAGACLLPGGEIVLVHWLGETDYPLSGDAAAETFIARADGFARLLRQVREAAYRIDVLRAG